MNAKAGAPNGFVDMDLVSSHPWLTLILRITSVNSFVEVVLCTRSSPKIKWNQYMRKMRIFGTVASLFPECYLRVTGNKREHKPRVPENHSTVHETYDRYFSFNSGNQYVFQNHLTVVGSEMINIHENRIGLIIFDR